MNQGLIYLFLIIKKSQCQCTDVCDAPFIISSSFLFFSYKKKSRIIDFICSALSLSRSLLHKIKRMKDDHIFAIMIASHSITFCSCLFSTSSMYIFILEFRTKHQLNIRSSTFVDLYDLNDFSSC